MKMEKKTEFIKNENGKRKYFTKSKNGIKENLKRKINQPTFYINSQIPLTMICMFILMKIKINCSPPAILQISIITGGN